MTLGEKIRELRKNKGYSLRELAKLTEDASHSYIAAIERGEYDPSLKKIRDIAQALNVPTAYLLDIYDQDHTNYKEKFKINESKNKNKYNVQKLVNVPIIGEIAAGQPIMAEERIIGYKQMPCADVKNGTYFLLKVDRASIEPARQDFDLLQ